MNTSEAKSEVTVLPDIIKSQSDKRLYRAIQLPNKLIALLIQDDEADKSAASLDVHVGSAHEETPWWGTAHFLEHMLFMGSEKYPSENEYSEYIKNNGGYSNAFTALTDTNYHFECSNEAFEGALDRMVQFFICPLLNENSADKEINNVNSEFNMSTNNDGWLQFRMIQELSHKDSKLNRFTCGNLESLKRDGVREKLLEFHKKWYSANIMKLTVIGRHSLDQLQQWAVDKFSPIENHDVVLPSLAEPSHPFPKECLGQFCKFRPIQDKDKLTLYWILPYCQKEWRAAPLNYLSHLFGHEGENSLFSYLKQEDLVMNLGASGDHTMETFSEFYIEMQLTKKGLENYQDVLKAVFKYAQNICNQGPQEWVNDETRAVGKLKFDYMERNSEVQTVVGFSRTMPRFESPEDFPHLIRHKYIADEFDAKRISEFAGLLADPMNSLIYLTSKSHKDEDLTSQEYWYKIKFGSSPFSEEMTQAMLKAEVVENGKKLDLPPKNTLLPKSFDLLPENKDLSVKPQLLQAYEEGELWFKKDDFFKKPKAFAKMRYYTNDCGFTKTVKARVFADMWVNILNETLREFSYLADCANLSLSTSLNMDHLDFSWSGYSDSIPNYVTETCKRIAAFQAAPASEDLRKIFEQEKESLLLASKNHYLQQTFRLCWGMSVAAMSDKAVEKSVLAECLKDFTYEEFSEMKTQWFKSGRLVWQMFGNLDSQAAQIVDECRACFNLQPTAKADLPDAPIICLPEGSESKVQFPVLDDANENSCVLVYHQIGNEGSDSKTKVLNEIMCNFLDEPTFNYMRTTEQLGYVVFTRPIQMHDVLSVQMLCQSALKCPSYIRNCFDKHFKSMLEQAKNMTDEEFEEKRKSVLVDLSAQDKNMAEAFGKFSGQVTSFKFNWEKQAQEIEICKAITKAEWQAFYDKTFNPETAKRFDLVYLSKAHQEQEKECEFKKDQKEFSGFNELKASCEKYPDQYKINYSQWQGKM